jgi:hypothetical protein
VQKVFSSKRRSCRSGKSGHFQHSFSRLVNYKLFWLVLAFRSWNAQGFEIGV